MQWVSAPEHSNLGRTGERPVQRLCLRQLAPTCLLPRPTACSNPTGICATGYLSMCGPLRARASLYIASLSSFSYISSMVLSPDALATLSRAKSLVAHARRSRTSVRPTCAILQSPPMLLPSPYRLSAHPRCVELLQAAPRHINCSSPPSLTAKRAPFLSRAPIEPKPEFGNCLFYVAAAQLSHPPAPLSRGFRVILPGAFAFSAGVPVCRPFAVSNTASSSAISVVQWW